MKKLLFLLPALVLLAGCGTKQPVVTVDTGSAEYLFSGYVNTGTVVTSGETYMEEEVLITTGQVSVNFPAQPTNLPGNHQENGTYLRAWAEKNIKTLDIPAGVTNVTITFKLAKMSKYSQIPGNIQLSVDGKNLCNGRLSDAGVLDNSDSSAYVYNLSDITTQDHPKGFDLSTAIGKTLTIKAWIGESNNYLESVTIDRTL